MQADDVTGATNGGARIPSATRGHWRAAVDQELGERTFESVLVHATPEGFGLQPLYTRADTAAIDSGAAGAAPFTRGTRADAPPFGVCMRVDPRSVRRPDALAEDLEGGADALWLDGNDLDAQRAARAAGVHRIIDFDMHARDGAPPREDLPEGDDGDIGESAGGDEWLGFDPFDSMARGYLDPVMLQQEDYLTRVLAPMAEQLADAHTRPIRVSGLAWHDAGANAADELALMMSTMVTYLRALEAGGIDAERGTGMLWFQLAVGRDTFGELCKLRALRVLAHKVLAAAGVSEAGIAAGIGAVHAVCATRTLTARDPWVNMLRVTTEVFAAALGGATFVTPRAFEEVLGVPSAHGRRVARNTALVLRDESHLGRVVDAGGGSYYLEARTDALARSAWTRFRAIEAAGGISEMMKSDVLHGHFQREWTLWGAAFAKRTQAVVGVTEFAVVDEAVPPAWPSPVVPHGRFALEFHRDAEAFEELRAHCEAATPTVALVTLGPAKEHRGRVGFATGFFAVAGLAPTETAEAATATATAVDIACLCGSDERYAAEAVAAARSLKAAGCKHVALAGRPGALEADLRAAGVDEFIFVGCNVLSVFAGLLS